ncbi:hypothetical protein KIH74_28645 [Kineosporia sp. J2-2]|uniref:PIN domain-containing protein n=2 Tax=Kineosporia corallincola TaxID=2835133 RepID=A0ABS5TQY0_9ACTN|nr:PIN domain-containing protein [Kineosporia corallincola]MBT0772946.1 hypothetical protein [Kineosporia corallincola]
MTISAVTLAEIPALPQELCADTEQTGYDERARRMEILRHAEQESDPIPLETETARVYGRLVCAVVTAGRKPRRRIADLMIASTAISGGLPLFTTNPDDFAGLDRLLEVVPVVRPMLPGGIR